MAMESQGTVLITGGCGFLGHLLATHLAPDHSNLILLDSAPAPQHRIPHARYVSQSLHPPQFEKHPFLAQIRSNLHCEIERQCGG